jgi:hypothetical protein
VHEATRIRAWFRVVASRLRSTPGGADPGFPIVVSLGGISGTHRNTIPPIDMIQRRHRASRATSKERCG